jgi:hypothetical protein
MTDQTMATEVPAPSQRAAAYAKDLKIDYDLDDAASAASFDALLTNLQLAIDAAKIKVATAKATLSALYLS